VKIMKKLNPFHNIPSIMTAEEIIEFAHNRSMKVSRKGSLKMRRKERTRIREIARLKEFTKQVKTKLKAVVEGFPSLDQLHPFYQELADIIVGTDELKKSLGAVYNCIPTINQITENHLEALKLANDYRKMKRSRSAAKGRIASVLRGTASNLDFIIEAKRDLARLPGILPNSPTIVCAGFPNVGKSTLVKAVSSAEPEIAYYPFTTKQVIVGHLRVRGSSVQIVDTPGILDRPMSERNEIEREAVATLKYLAHIVLFIIDPSQSCGWSIDEQFNLYSEVKRLFPVSPILVAFNKIDITPEDKLEEVRSRIEDAYEIVATEGIGVDALIEDAVELADIPEQEESIEDLIASVVRGDASSFDG
jgi:nucleolar GTP-binding protein